MNSSDTTEGSSKIFVRECSGSEYAFMLPLMLWNFGCAVIVFRFWVRSVFLAFAYLIYGKTFCRTAEICQQSKRNLKTFLWKLAISIPPSAIGVLLPLRICGVSGLLIAVAPYYAGVLLLFRTKLADISLFKFFSIDIEKIRSEARPDYDNHVYVAQPVEAFGIAIEDGNQNEETILAVVQKIDHMREG